MSGAVSEEVSRLSSLSNHTMAPSPPPRAIAPSTGGRITEIRARRLKISNMGDGMGQLSTETIISDVTASRDKNHKVLSPGALQLQPAQPLIRHKPHRPGSCPGITPQRECWYVLFFFFVQQIHKVMIKSINLTYQNIYIV